MTLIRQGITALLAMLAPAGPATAADAAPQLVASTPPLHALVAGVSGDRAGLHLLVPAGNSPHSFSLAPSDARALAHADAVFTAGGTADDFLERPLTALAGEARVLRMADVPGVRRLPARASGAWTAHADHAEHGGEHDHGHGQAGTLDPHLWLDPHNAVAFTRAVADTLAALDPDHADRYQANASAQVRRLRALDAHLRAQLAPVADRPYLVFHDAYQYFEARYGLAAAGSIAVDPARPPGARRLSELRSRVARMGIDCLFTEPQFPPRVARVIAAGNDVRVATLDPLGAGLTPGPALYPRLLERLADSLRECLQPASGG